MSAFDTGACFESYTLHVKRAIFFLFSIWHYLMHVSALLMYIHYNSNMGGRHRMAIAFQAAHD